MSCYFFGEMFIPGLLMGLVGLVAFGSGLLAIPGLCVAMGIWRLGPRLLNRSRDAVPFAGRVIRASYTLNLILLALIAIVLVASLPFDSDDGWAMGALMTLPYVIASLLQATLLKVTIEKYGYLYDSEAEYDPALETGGALLGLLPAEITATFSRRPTVDQTSR